MRQLTFVKPGRLEWWDVPKPRLANPGDAIVRPLAVARCDLDPLIITGRTPLRGPFALGHEFVAEIVELDDTVRGFQPKQRVLVPFQIGCGTCANCLRGQTGSCSAVPLLSAFGLAPLSGIEYGGALSDFVRVPFAAAMLVPMPDSVSPEVLASGTDNLPDGWRTVGPHLATRPGARVLVVGGGTVSVGLYAIAAALALGSDEVVYVDWDRQRLDLAASLGAVTRELKPQAGMRIFGQFPITVDASCDPAGLSLAVRSAEPGGVCTSPSIYFSDSTPMPLLAMYTRGVTFVTGRINSRAALPNIVELVTSGRLAPDPITTLKVPFSAAAEAMFDPNPKVVFHNDQLLAE